MKESSAASAVMPMIQTDGETVWNEKREGTTILMATHSSDDVREQCDTIREMDCDVINKRDDLNSFPTI